jgi:RNA methyltransferase, TrmH family
MKVKKYSKKYNYSYFLGAYPILDLIKTKKTRIFRILLKEEGLKSEGIDEILKFAEEEKIPFEVNYRLIEKIAFKENTYVIAFFEKYECELEEKENHVVLVNPSNMGNLGTIVRTMVAFGFKNLALVKPAADIFDPKVVRSAMGALFYINFKYFDSFEEYVENSKGHDIYPFMLDGGENIEKVVFKKPFSLVFGNEGSGLSSEFKKYGKSIYIPQSKDVDSLNLSMSVGIALYASSKK